MQADTKLSGEAGDSVRINDIAIADVDADGRADIVSVGRSGPYHPDGTNDDLAERRETGDVAVLDGKTLELRARKSWLDGSSLRLRSVAIANRPSSSVNTSATFRDGSWMRTPAIGRPPTASSTRPRIVPVPGAGAAVPASRG
jgi:hypothetical protein